MRRLLRWTFNTLAMASLLLCLATAGLWVRSYWNPDRFDASSSDRQLGAERYAFFVGSDQGQVAGVVFWLGLPGTDSPHPWDHAWEFRLNHDTTRLEGLSTDLGFHGKHVDYGGIRVEIRTLRLPAWSLASAFAVLPAIVAVRQIRAIRRRRRSRLGLCPACGYDLRASPERCPECGRQDDKVKG